MRVNRYSQKTFSTGKIARSVAAMKAILALFVLLAIASASMAADKDITPLITGVVWKWDHPNAKDRSMKFRTDGTCETTLWKGVWKIIGERKVDLNNNGLHTVITFNDRFTGFEGVHHDGQAVVGRRVGDVPVSLR